MRARVYAFLTGFVVFILAAVAARGLTSAFGSSATNTAAIGFSVLLGIVLGVFYFTPKYERAGSGTRVLGLVQAATAICFLILITVLPAMHRAYAFMHSLGPTSPGALLAARWFLTIALLVVPGFLLGGSMVIISVMGGAAPASRASDSIGAAFLGLAVAVPLVALVVLPRWGGSMALAMAAIMSVAMSASSLISRAGARDTAGIAAAGSPGGSADRLIAAGVLLISCAAVSHTGVYMRVLHQVTGINAYTFVANALVVTLGIFIGCTFISRLLHAGRNGTYYTGIFALLATVYMLTAAGWVDSLPVRFLAWTDSGSATTGGFVSAYFYFAAMTLLVPALLLGTALGGVAAPGGLKRVLLPAGDGAALAYALALPVIAGALGLDVGLMFIAGICLAGGIALTGAGGFGRKLHLTAVVPAVILAVALTAAHRPWNRSVLSSGVYNKPHTYAGVDNVADALAGSDIAYYGEGIEGVVSAVRTPDGTFLRLNGKDLGATGERIAPDILAAHVPMLIRGQPENVLLLGLGTGVTLGSIQRHEVESITVAEPVEAVIVAAQLFSPYSYGALEDRRTEVLNMGPREFMRLARDKYDVIIYRARLSSDPVRASDLSLDFMLLARSALTYDGVFCYSIDLSGISRECVMTTVGSFMATFPYVTAWYAGSANMLLVGSMEPYTLSEAGIAAGLERPWVSNDLKRLQINDATGVLANLLMDREALRTYLGVFSGSNTDNRPGPACSTVPVVSPADAVATLSDVNKFRLNPIKAIVDFEEGSIEYKLARDRYDRCQQAGNYYVGSYLALGSGDQPEAARRLEYGVGLCSANGLMKERLSYLYMYISRSLAAAGRFDEAINVARRAIEVSPVSYLAFYNLADLERTRDPETAIALLERLSQLNPGYVPADIVRAELLLEIGRAADASETISEVLSREPMNRRAHHVRALCFVERGLTEAARVELEYVLDAEPDNVDALAALGYTWLLVGDIGEAEKYYGRAYRLAPDNLAVLNNYATVLAEKGKYREAVLVWQEALKLDPANAGIRANIREATGKLGED